MRIYLDFLLDYLDFYTCTFNLDKFQTLDIKILEIIFFFLLKLLKL